MGEPRSDILQTISQEFRINHRSDYCTRRVVTGLLRYASCLPPFSPVVFPAAGLDKRILPATKAFPKELLPLVDRPIIQYGGRRSGRRRGLAQLVLRQMVPFSKRSMVRYSC